MRAIVEEVAGQLGSTPLLAAVRGAGAELVAQHGTSDSAIEFVTVGRGLLVDGMDPETVTVANLGGHIDEVDIQRAANTITGP